LVFFELNGKYDLTLSLVSAGKGWKIEKKIFGKPELYNGESDTHKQVAILLSKNENSNAYDLLKKYSAIYPDSPDLKYYWGLYHSLNKNSGKSKKSFIDAIEIDPDFTEAKYNYAFLLHTENKISDAKELYYEILEVDENEPKTLNNLASILIDENKLAEAKELLERCLKEVPDFEVAMQNLERIK
jgi:tetratricopeptide (TPR) repeat protein